jgi:hypothetical protein
MVIFDTLIITERTRQPYVMFQTEKKTPSPDLSKTPSHKSAQSKAQISKTFDKRPESFVLLFSVGRLLKAPHLSRRRPFPLQKLFLVKAPLPSGA